MTTENVPERWTIRSTLVAVTDLDRSVAFYGEIGPFDEIFREDAVAVLGEMLPATIALILRETRGIHCGRHGQQSLGARSIHFNVRSLGELDRIESVLRGRDLFTSRRPIADGACGPPVRTRSGQLASGVHLLRREQTASGRLLPGSCQSGLFAGRLTPPMSPKSEATSLSDDARVVLDFSGVTSFDNLGLEAALGLVETVRSSGGRVSVGDKT